MPPPSPSLPEYPCASRSRYPGRPRGGQGWNLYSPSSQREESMPLPNRIIPSTGESLPVYGMGSWKTFDVPPGPERERMRPVLDGFFAGGGTVIDSSPMYGRSEEALG